MSASFGSMPQPLSEAVARYLGQGPEARYFDRLVTLLGLRRRLDFRPEDRESRYFLHLAFSLRDKMPPTETGEIINAVPDAKNDIRWEVLFDGGGDEAALQIIDAQIRFVVFGKSAPIANLE